jgi:hypothetical protein
MIYSEEQWKIQKQQTETLQKFLEGCCKAMEIENDRQEAIGVLQSFDRQKAIDTLLKILDKYYFPNHFLMNALRLGNISDWQLHNELNNIVQSIYLVAIIKYCAEEAIKSMAKQALETSRKNGWNF